MHLGRHELARCHNDIFALLAGEVAVDISRVPEEVCGVALQQLHVLQRPLKLLCLLDDLETWRFHSLIEERFSTSVDSILQTPSGPYSAVLLQLAAAVWDGVHQTLMDDTSGHFLPNQLPQNGRKLFVTDGHI